jgi:BON domain
MPTPIDIITKPLQIGAQVAFGAIQEVQKRFGGAEEEQPPQPHQKLQREEQERQGQRPAAQRRQAKPKPLDDVTITRKVESVLFRDDSVDKGKLSVNTVDGVVSLRGEAKNPDTIKSIEAKVQAIPEVKQVENLLHLPKTEPSAKKTRKPSAAASPRRRAPKRTTAERPPTTAAAEPSPKEVAAKGEGRKPAPLGANEDGA